LGTQYLYDFIDHNTSFCFTPFSHVNTSTIIAKNDNMRAINSALAVDLLGQVSAESMGFRQYSGTGGQVDIVRGAMHSKGGKAIIAMTSVAETSQGPVSKIVLNFEPGTAVTTLRSDAQYVVTEYGAVNLQYRDIPTRAKMLISIAHPDYRERLTYDAKKTGLIY
jgi:acyl-CoA hydrolase